MKKLMNWLKNEESGQGMVEYGLIIVVVALIAVVGMKLLGGNLQNLFTNIGEKVDKPVSY